jgi:hypothetical protein
MREDYADVFGTADERKVAAGIFGTLRNIHQ